MPKHTPNYDSCARRSKFLRLREFDDSERDDGRYTIEHVARRNRILARTALKSERETPVTMAVEILTCAAEREIVGVFLARMATLQAIHR
jgi:hypothetical protein